MRKALFIALVLVLAGVCSARAGGFDNRRLGVEGSWTWNMTGWSAHDGDNMEYGCNIGVCYKLMNRQGWFFEPTLSFSYGDYEFYNSDAAFKTSLTAIELPIKFGHDFHVGFLDMTVSPLIAVKPVFALGGHLAVDGVRYPWNRFNIAGCFGFGLLFENKIGINIRGDINLLKSFKDVPEGVALDNHSGMVNITAKYYF